MLGSTWYRITVFGRDAEIISQYAAKGSALSFNGRLQTDSYTDREGQQRTSICLIADSFEFVPIPKRTDEDAEAKENTEAGPEATEENKPSKKKRKGTKPEIDPDDILDGTLAAMNESDGDRRLTKPLSLFSIRMVCQMVWKMQTGSGCQ